ncbi:MAG: hypothetical protein HGA49_01415 [Eubacteriaceae bacterium]|nr:hypothetical protein [Eubacteriaceae bacterium]
MNKILLIIITILLLGGCSSDYINDRNGQIPGGGTSPEYVDGEYYSTFSHGDDHGYRPELRVTIFNGVITKVWYREIGTDGLDKIENADFNQEFAKTYNTDLKSLYSRLYNSLIQAQSSSDLPSLKEIPDTVNYFKLLSDNILNNAIHDTKDKEVLPMDEIYYAQSDYDESGFKGALSVTFINNVITNAEYNETDKNGLKKEEADEIDENYKEYYSVSLREIYDKLAKSVIKQNNLEKVDGITGATNSTLRINLLLQQIKEKRIPY